MILRFCIRAFPRRCARTALLKLLLLYVSCPELSRCSFLPQHPNRHVVESAKVFPYGFMPLSYRKSYMYHELLSRSGNKTADLIRR